MPWTLALENLSDGDGNQITPKAHATCPGRAVTFTYEWDWAPGAEAAYRAAHGLADDDDQLRLLSSRNNTCNRDYHAETPAVSRARC